MEDAPWTLETPPMARAGAASTPEDGVYFVPVVRALEPAEAEADEEKEVTAPAPLAPDEALLWM